MTQVAIQSEPCVTTATATAVRTEALRLDIDNKNILRDLSFEIPSAQYIALLGSNGAGKSTLLKVLATLIAPTAGVFSLFDTPVTRETIALRRRIGMIAHGSMLYRDLSARENLLFFGRLYDVNDPAGRADELLDRVGLTRRAHDPVKTFSRGMVQRVTIARALMHDPDLLLADEPFTGLDASGQRLVEKLFEQLHRAGKTIIAANHNIEQSLQLSTRALVLHRGQLAIDEPTARLDAGTLITEVMGR